MTFRQFCQHKWNEHCEEVFSWTGHNPSYKSHEYFNKYKYWLKREYRYATSKWE